MQHVHPSQRSVDLSDRRLGQASGGGNSVGEVGLMPLKLRPTGLGSGIDKDRPDYTVFTGKWKIGRIYQTRGVSRTICAGSDR
jgi:hypothetical protein